jgi:hypothetical protein
MDASEQQLQTSDKENTKQLVTVDFNFSDAALADMKERFKNLVVGDAKSFEATKKAREEVRQVRYNVQNALKAGNKELQEKKKANDAEAERLISLIMEVETPLDEEVKRWEKKKADEKAERERQEKERTDKIHGMINWMADTLRECVGKDSEFIGNKLAAVNQLEITDEAFQEFINHATATKAETLEALNKMLTDRLAHEENERARIAAEDEARKAQEEAERIQQDAQAIIDAEREKQQKEKDARDLADRQRDDAFKMAVSIKDKVIEAADLSSEKVELIIRNLSNLCPSDEFYGEHIGQVVEAKSKAIEALTAIKSQKLANEQRQAEEAEKERKAKAEQEAREQAERDEQERIQQEEVDRLERERLEALRPDREKLVSHLTACIQTIPKMTTEDGALLAHDTADALNAIISKLEGDHAA